MFKVFVNAWKVQDIRKKILYVILILAIYRLGAHIPLPGIDLALFTQARNNETSTAALLFSIISGGGYGTILSMGIGPYITASIIMQLLTVAIPKLEQIQKEGEEGRKKINQYTRIVAVFLAFFQGAGTVYRYRGLFFYTNNYFVYFVAVLSMVAGTMFVMWLSEILTEKGIGNGSSFIIFANILSNLPSSILSLYVGASQGDIIQIVKVVAVLILLVLIIAFVVLIQDGERRIPVQYSKKMVGRTMFGGQSSFIPIKVNIAGVMSIIFSISLLQFPSIIAQFFNTPWLTDLIKVLNITHPIGAVIYVVLIFFFTFFYTSFAINPIEMAENMKKNSGFVPGIRPGKPTSDYIQRTINRLSWIGAVIYAIIAMFPVVLQWLFKIQVGLSGTTLLILTGVALEIVKQLESQLLMRHYKGFLS